MLIAKFIDDKLGDLRFTLDILECELVLLVNILPPPSKGRVWVSLCDKAEPKISIKLKASGASPRLVEMMNRLLMPTVETAIIKGFLLYLKDKFTFPNMKDFTIPL